MILNKLTKEQKYTIAKFYKLYIERSNKGDTESKANYFGDAKNAQEDYFCDRNYKDFYANCIVLIEQEYLRGDIEEDNIYNISILTKTFVEIEQSFG
ncbi:Phage protein [Staphylococcus schweitzeri]|uniref:Phage protein n=1 Tax=Staphylococcus schweitzeri TaxID=1654388 RepID=A0A077V4Y8_9STAP|nr:Phage protein [Staphylococcus schweitzeri]CDR55216.1 Phage protein [Staphylococcus schweitzeri]CDR62430.1 Phage protein [Staphylococcus schweitzeri]VEE65424.1 Uncharacterised protein [Staphylococcus schweitzeri]